LPFDRIKSGPGSVLLTIRSPPRSILKPRRYVDAVTIELVAIDDHVAEVDANPKLHSPVGRQTRVFAPECVLNLDCALDSVDYAAELGQDTVGRSVNEPPAMSFDAAVYDFAIAAFNREPDNGVRMRPCCDAITSKQMRRSSELPRSFTEPIIGAVSGVECGAT